MTKRSWAFLFFGLGLLAGCANPVKDLQNPIWAQVGQLPSRFTSFAVLSGTDRYEGTIGASSVEVLVPWNVDLTNLVPEFESDAMRVVRNGSDQTSGQERVDFHQNATYELVGRDGVGVPWTVTVRNRPPLSSSILSFGLVSSLDGRTVFEGTLEGTQITVPMPWGTDFHSLKAVFILDGKTLKVGRTKQVSRVTANNFTSPVVYTLVGTDGFEIEYTVTAVRLPAVSITVSDFEIVSPDGLTSYPGTISGHNIAVVVPGDLGTRVLSARFHLSSGHFEVSRVRQKSGVTFNDYSSPVTFTHVGDDGWSEAYQVTLRDAPVLSSFQFDHPAVTGTVEGYEVWVSVPFGTNVKNLIPRFSTDAASVLVGSTPQVSGVTANDYFHTVPYTLRSPAGDTSIYQVRVAWADPTSFVLRSPTAAPSGLGGNAIADVAIVGSWLLAATDGGGSASKDGGATWRNAGTAQGLGSDSVQGLAVDGSRVWAATRGGLSVSSDAGLTWTTKTTAQGLGSNRVQDVAVSGVRVFAATEGGLSVSHDGGSTWANLTTAQGLAGNNVLRVLLQGDWAAAETTTGVCVSVDGGTTWRAATLATVFGAIAAKGFFSWGTSIVALTSFGVFLSQDGGATWTLVLNTSNLALRAYAVSAGVVYIATNQGLWISADQGLTWTNRNTTNGLVSNNLWGVAVEGSAITVAASGGVCTSADSGYSWAIHTTKLFEGSEERVEELALTSAAVFAGGTWGAARSVDQGSTWTDLRPALASGALHSLSAQGSLVLAGSDGGLSISSDEGVTWRLAGPSTGLGVGPVTQVLARASHAWAATANGLYSSADGGARWIQLEGTSGWNDIQSFAVDGSTIVVARSESKLLVTKNSGATWTQVPLRDQFDEPLSVGSVSVANGTWAAAATDGGLWVSVDGTHWSQSLGFDVTISHVLVTGSAVFAVGDGDLSLLDGQGELQSIYGADFLGAVPSGTIVSAGQTVAVGTESGVVLLQ